jgi:hypothetical protein
MGEFKALAAVRSDACVSIYVPTSPLPDHARANRTTSDNAKTYNVVDEVAKRALCTGARVLGAKREELPGGAQLIAVLRYQFGSPIHTPYRFRQREFATSPWAKVQVALIRAVLSTTFERRLIGKLR